MDRPNRIENGLVTENETQIANVCRTQARPRPSSSPRVDRTKSPPQAAEDRCAPSDHGPKSHRPAHDRDDGGTAFAAAAPLAAARDDNCEVAVEPCVTETERCVSARADSSPSAHSVERPCSPPGDSSPARAESCAVVATDAAVRTMDRTESREGDSRSGSSEVQHHSVY